MLRRRAKAYSNSCSQTVISSHFVAILGVCAAAEDRKNQ